MFVVVALVDNAAIDEALVTVAVLAVLEVVAVVLFVTVVASEGAVSGK